MLISLFLTTFLACTAPTSFGSSSYTRFVKKSGAIVASASNTRIASPFANSKASFSTADFPGKASLGLIKAITFSGYFFSKSLSTDAVLSVLLSSIAIISKFG